MFLVVTVQCLACEATYSKPAGRDTVRNNPGCPHCGYVGWSESESRVTEEVAPIRSDADLPLGPLARLH